jgi:MSHA biogenesis protein MshK
VSETCKLPTLLLVLLLGLCAAAAGAESLADPTRPPRSGGGGSARELAQEPLPHWDLQAIVLGEERRIAVINGRPLAEGSRLGAASLLRIERDRVLLRYQGQTVELKLPRVEGVRKGNHKSEGKP